MRNAPSPGGLLSLLVVATVFLLVSLLAVEATRSAALDPNAVRALDDAAAAFRALPDGSPLLDVPKGVRTASYSGEVPGGPGGWSLEWTVQAYRWDAGRGAFVAATGGSAAPLLRVTVRVRPRRAAGSIPAAPAATRTFLRSGPAT